MEAAHGARSTPAMCFRGIESLSPRPRHKLPTAMDPGMAFEILGQGGGAEVLDPEAAEGGAIEPKTPGVGGKDQAPSGGEAGKTVLE